MRGGIFSCIRFGKFSLFVLKTANLEVVGNFYPLPCRIGLSLFLSSNNPIPHGVFSGFLILTHAYEDIQ